MKMLYLSLAIIAILLAPSMNMYQLINACAEIKTSIVDFEDATYAIIDGDNEWAHFESGVLIIDFNGERIRRKGFRIFGSSSDPVFTILNGGESKVNINITVVSNNIPRGTIIILFIKTSSKTMTLPISKESVGCLLSFTLNMRESARIWIAIGVFGASPSFVEVDLRLDGSAESLWAKILDFIITFEII